MSTKTRDDWRQGLETATRPDHKTSSGLPAVDVPGLTILCHPDPRRIGEMVALPRLARGEEARLSRSEPEFAQPGQAPARPLADSRLSRSPVVIRSSGDGGLEIDVTGTSTRLLVANLPVEAKREITRFDLELGVVVLHGAHVALLLHLCQPTIVRPPSFDLVGESATMLRLRREIEQVADLKMPVLLRGESGTGKELVARAIRDASPRREKPYFAINMAAIPPTLAAAELFGAARGAFSGADRKRLGYFQRAEGGTLFLDEVGDMPPEVQALLLRALESSEIQPVGAEVPVSVDVRILAATDSNLEAAIASGQFRAPLLHRLSSYEIVLPPLRSRRADIGRLIVHFLRQELEEIGEAYRLTPPGPHMRPWLDAEIIARLADYDWPGNVRELRNVVRQLVVGSRGQETMTVGSRVEGLISNVDRSAPTPAAAPRLTEPPVAKAGPAKFRDPSEVTEDALLDALREHRWSLKPTATALRISRTALYKLIEGCPRVRKATDLSAQEIEAAAARFEGRIEAMAEHLAVSKHGLKMRLRELGLKNLQRR